MNLLPLLLLVIVIAFVTGSDSLFYLAYALAGISVLSHFWTRQSIANVRVERHFSPRVFYGEKIVGEITLFNPSWLPTLWIELHESLPLALHVPNFERRVISLAPHERTSLRYELNCTRRGYYAIGPLRLQTGDLFGITSDRERLIPADSLIVYPRIVPLRRLAISSQLPFGTIASRQRIFEDPSRFFGVRNYEPGDSLRRIHWKSSARMEQLQVKRFQPSIALHTLIVLDLNTEAYTLHSRATAGEMGIIVAASLAAHLIEKRQPVGLAVLGMDQVTAAVGLQTIQPAHGRNHLMRLLDVLARIEMANTTPLTQTLAHVGANLGWGSTVIVITAGEKPGLVPALLQLQKQGLNVLLVVTDWLIPVDDLRGQLKQFGIPLQAITEIRDMDVWR